MVQVIENLTQLVGTIVARRPNPELDGYDIVTLEIERAMPVEGMPNLLAVEPRGKIDVTIRHALLGAATIGMRIHCRAKRTPKGAMCEPYPNPVDFSIA